MLSKAFIIVFFYENKGGANLDQSIIQYLIAVIIFEGVSSGVIYALSASGLSFLLGTLGVPNTAHGHFIIIGAYFLFITVNLLGFNLLLSFILSLAFCIGCYFVIEKLLMSPFYGLSDRSSAYLNLMAGLSLVISNILERTLTTDVRSVTTPFEWSISIGLFSARANRLIGTLIALTLVCMVLFFSRYTKTGKAMRAISQDREIANVMGINVKKISAEAALIGSCLASLAGMIYALSYSFEPSLISGWLLVNFALVVVGGMRSVLGSIVVGMTFGLVQAAVTVMWQPIVADYLLFIILLIILFRKPSGLFRR
jgi:branched-chain amino acid transport system permease protein